MKPGNFGVNKIYAYNSVVTEKNYLIQKRYNHKAFTVQGC